MLGLASLTMAVACARSSGSAEIWESQIAAFEQADAAEPPAPGAILFVGSSSIRMWSELARDMAPLRVLNRGFGGAHLAHVNHFASRIVTPYRPRAIVVYAGDNDLADGTGKTPESVAADFDRFVEIARGLEPAPDVFFLSIKPSRLRWDRWPAMREANALVEARTERDPRLHYIDVARPMLASGSPPAADLFLLDGLHLSAEGYRIWADRVRGQLEATLGEP